MRQSLSIIKQFFLSSDDMPTPRHPVSTKWAVWVVAVIILFDMVIAKDILSYNSRTAVFVVIGILPSIWAFHDKNYVQLKLKKRFRNLLVYLYRINIFWMVFGTVMQIISYWGEIGLPFLARESVFLSFWFLSIPLVLVYKLLRWGIWAGIIFLVTIGYYILLQWYINCEDATLFVSWTLIAGNVLIAAVIGFKASCYKIKQLFG